MLIGTCQYAASVAGQTLNSACSRDVGTPEQADAFASLTPPPPPQHTHTHTPLPPPSAPLSPSRPGDNVKRWDLALKDLLPAGVWPHGTARSNRIYMGDPHLQMGPYS